MSDLSPELLSRLKQVEFPEDQYRKEKHGKFQIVIHHTASGGDGLGDIRYWKSTKERVATFVVIDRDGTIYQCFNSAYWAAALGTGLPGNRIAKQYLQKGVDYDKHALQIELDSWGWLKEKEGKFYSWTGVEVDRENVVEYVTKFRGHKYYEKYTDAQIESLKHLLLYLGKTYNIPLDYYADIFDICERALNMKPGLYTHCCYRTDKTDAHPQEELINMLMSLTKGHVVEDHKADKKKVSSADFLEDETDDTNGNSTEEKTTEE